MEITLPCFRLGQVGVGLLIPLLFELTNKENRNFPLTLTSIMTLIGGFFAVAVIIIGGQAFPLNILDHRNHQQKNVAVTYITAPTIKVLVAPAPTKAKTVSSVEIGAAKISLMVPLNFGKKITKRSITYRLSK